MPINDYEQIAADYAKGQPVGVGGPAPEPIATPVPSAPAPRPYDELLHNKNLLQEQELQQMMYLAKNRDPEQVAKAKKLSDETGLPLGFVERNYDEVHKRSNSVLPDYAKIVRDTPGLAKFLEDPDNAALSKDDLAGLAKVDMATRMFVPKPRDSYFDLPMELGRAGESGLHRLKASAFHLGAALGKVDKREAAETVAAAKLRARELQEQMPSYAKDFNKDFEVEMKDASRAWNRFTGSFDRLREGKIFQAYTDLQLGRLQLVGEAMDMLLTAAKHPRGFLYSGVEQVSNMLPSLATRLAGGAAGAAVGSAVPGIGTAVGTGVGLFSGNFVGSVGTEIGAWIDQRLEEKGFDLTNPDDIERAYNDQKLMSEILAEATRKGVGTAAVDSLLSAFAGVGGAGKGASLAKKAASTGKKLALETVGEAGGEFAGQAAAYKGDVRKVNFGEVLQEGILSLGTSGVTVAGDSIRSRYSKDTIKATEQFTKDYQNAQQSINEGVALNELGQAVNEAKLTGRVPEKLAELVTEAGGDSGAVYFQTDDFDSYWNKKGLSPVKAAEQIMGDEGKAYFEAKQNGTPLEVSLGDYASKVAPTEDFSGLNEIARARPDGMTLTEAQEFMQSLPGTMQELAKEATEVSKATQDSMAELSQIKRMTSQQLMALDIGFTKDQADAYATWQAQRINARAQVLGTTPLEVYKSDSLELITGDKMPADAETEKIFNQARKKPTKEAVAVKEELKASLGEAGKELTLNISEGHYSREAGFEGSAEIEPKRLKRAKAQGFDTNHLWFHGSRANIEAFSGDTLGSSTGAGSAKLAHFFASSPQTASSYAEASDNALWLRSQRVEGEATRSEKTFKERMREKYGAQWIKKLSPSEKAERKQIKEMFEQSAKDFEAAQESTPARVEMAKHNVQSKERDIRYMEQQLKEGAVAKQNAELQDMLSYSESLLDNTEWVKGPDGGTNIINKATGERLVNRFLADKEGESRYRFFEPKESLENKVEKIRERIKGNTEANLRQSIADAKEELKDLQDNLQNILDGVGGQTVYPVVLKTENPLIVDFNGAEYREVTYREILEKAKAHGYDSVIFKNTYDPAFLNSGDEELIDVVAVFEPQQIRSTSAQFKEAESPLLLAQSGGPLGPRGSIQFLDKKTIIRLGQAKDPSTFIHELGHFWLEQMGQDFQRVTAMTERTGAQEQFLKDVAETLNYLGVKDFSEIGVEHHEKWARSVEAYAMEGKSPSSALRRVLSKFKVWLTSVYRDLRNLNVQLTPEIRKVMDRLVATEEEIAAAEREQNFEPLFADPTAFGMKGKAAEAYITAREEARTAADQKLRAMVMKDLERERSKEYEARREQVKALVTEEISQQQVYQAITQLQFGNQFDGTPMKLNKKDIVNMMGSGILEQLPKPLIYTVKGGISPNEAATYFGYASGEEMLKSMVGVPKIETAIEAETNRRMAAEFPDTHTQEEFVEGAMEAIHNDQRAKVLRMELEHMASNDFTSLKRVVNKAVRRVPSEKAVKQHAAKIIGQNSVRALKPNLFLRAEAKASRDAANALTAGDFDAAFLAKRNELLNHELFRASMAAKEKVQKTREFAKKVFKADEPMAKTRDMNLVNAARSVFAAYGLGKSDKAPGDYLKLMEAYDPGAFETMQSLVDTVMEGAGPYKDVSYDKFTEMADTAKALWDLAKSHKSMEIEGQKVEQDLVKEELLERLDEVTKLPDNGGYSRLPGAKEERKSFFLGARAAGTRVEHWAQSLGPNFVKYIYKPVKDKAVLFRAERHKKFLEFDKILEPIAKTITTQDIVSDELKHIFKGNSEIIGGLLHTGNASNYRKYLIGNGWATLSEDGILDDSRYQAFIKRMAAEGKVTKAHMDAVQKIWDLFESVKAGAQEAHYKRYGFHFNEITAQPVVTPWGEYKGGYAPAIADPTRASDAAQRAEKALLEGQQNAGMFPHTDRGFTKGRIENYAAPLISDLRLVPQHIDKVLRFTHMEPVVNQVARLLWDKQFRKGLDNFDEAVVQELLVPWLHRSATQKTSTPALGSKWFKTLNRWAGVLRGGVGQNIMVLNVTNAMQNVTGLSVAAVKVKPRYLRNAMWDKLTDSAKTAEFIQNKSFFMANELSSSFHEVQQRIENVLLNPSKFEKVGQFSRENGYILQKHSQNFMNQVAWLGAYNQAVEAGMSDKDAVAAADSVVRTTQGSMTPEDISRLEASSDLAKLFLMFYGYFNNQANLLGSEYQKIVRDQGLKSGAGRALYLYFWGFMVPAVMSEVIVRAMSGKGIDEDDDDQYLDDVLNVFFGSQVRTASAFFPLVGQTAMAGINAWNDKWYDDRISTSPAVSMIESAVKSPHSVYKAIVEDGNKKTAIRDTMSLLGLVTRLPLAPLSKPLGYASDVAEGKVKSSGPIDFTRGLITGKGPKQ